MTSTNTSWMLRWCVKFEVLQQNRRHFFLWFCVTINLYVLSIKEMINRWTVEVLDVQSELK